MPDAQIFSGPVGNGFSDYTLPDRAEFTLKAVNAIFEDAGAGSDWLPAVVIFSDSGHVIARAADQAVLVTGGDDAEVSWFPGVKNVASAASPVLYGVADIPAGTSIAVPSGVTTAIEFTAWDSNDFTVWKNNLPNHDPTLPSSTTMFAALPGVYLVHAAVTWEAGNYNRAVRLESFEGQSWLTTHPLLGTNTRYDADATLKTNQIPPHIGTEALDGRAWGIIVNPSAFPPLGFEVLLNQDSGSPKNVGFQIFVGVRIGDV
jgi:hypothetical protein